MATIPVLPTVEMNAGQAGTFSAPEVRPMENFAPKQMVAMGEATLKAGLSAMKIADQIQTELDDAKTKELDMAFADRIRENLYNAESGYMNSIGKSAVDRRQATEEAMNKSRQEIEQSLQNDVQRMMFRQIADKRMLAARTEMDQHALKQLKVYNVGESKARIDNLLDDAVVNANNWAVPGSQYQVFSKAMKSEVTNLARLSGIAEGSEQYRQLEREATTKLHSTVIANFIAQENPQMAEAYLKDHKGEIDKEQLDNITTAVRNAKETLGVKEESLRLSFELKGPLNQQISNLDQMFKDGKITASVRDATLQRIEHNDSVRRAQQGEYEKNLIGNAQEWLLKNPDKSILDMPTAMYNGLRNSGHLGSMISFAKAGRYVTDPKAMQEIMNLTPDQLGRMTDSEFYAKYRGRLDDQDLNYGLARLNSAKGTATTQHLEIISTADRVERAAIEMGILPSTGAKKASADQTKAFDTFRADVNQRVMVYEQSVLGGKRKANNEELQQVLDTVIKDKAIVPRTLWFDKGKPVSQLTTEEMKRAYVTVGAEQVPLASIPVAQRKIIIQKLNDRRLPVTEQAIADLWVAAGKPR